MKKIIVINIFSLMALTAWCQENAAKIPSLAKDVPKELTINGKPYSQYKAEQDALKKQQEAASRQVVIQSQKEISITATGQKPAPVKVQPVASKPSNGAMVDDGQTDLLKAASEMSKNVPKTKEPVVQKPAVIEQQPDVKNGETLPATPPMMSIPKPDVSSGITSNNDITATKPVETQKPEVPDQFKLSSSGTWTNKPADTKNSTTATKPVEQLIPKEGAMRTIPKPVEANKTVVTDDVKPVEKQKPQVPDQFRLPANTPTWDGKPVADKTTQTAVQTTSVKLPEVKFVKEDATPKTTTTSNQVVPAEKAQPSSTDTNLPVKKQN